MTTRIILAWAFWAFYSSIYGQQYSFNTFSTPQGLPQSQVSSIAEDNQGYLWIGTLGGLARFNGYSFNQYSIENGLFSNRVTSVDCIDGVVWIGHEGGLTRFKGGQFTHYQLPETLRNEPIVKVQQFQNRLFIATNGGGLFEVVSNKLIRVKGLANTIVNVRDLVEFNGQLVMATRSGLVSTKNGSKFEVWTTTRDTSFSALAVSNNTLFASTFNYGTFAFDSQGQLISRTSGEQVPAQISDLLVAEKDKQWLTTNQGIFSISTSGIQQISDYNGLPLNTLSCIFKDSQGNIWIGSQGKGLVRLPASDMMFFDKNSGMPSELIISGFQSPSGHIYLGSYDSGVMKYSRKTGFSLVDFPYNQTIWSACSAVDNCDWFGTRSSLVSIDKTTGKSREYSVEDGLPGYKITSLLKLNASSMLVGGSDGVVKYSRGKFSAISTNGESIGTVRDLIYYQNQLIVGTDLGLFVLQGRKFIPYPSISQTVFALEKDNQNTLWIGTQEGLFTLVKGEIKEFKFASEPTSKYINFLIHRKDKLFIGTNNGLFVFTGTDLLHSPSIQQFGLNDGLVDLETNLNSAFFDRENNLWFGTAAGLVKMNPWKANLTGKDIRISLQSILLNYKPFSYGNYGEIDSISGLPIKLNLPYSKNNVLFEFDAVSLSTGNQFTYQYWLEGQEETWSPSTENTSVSYSGLSSGSYILHVRVIDIFGHQMDELTYPFEISPPFYLTWWFITLMVLIIIFLIYLIIQLRIRREREKAENERMYYQNRLMALEQQSLNASMNRHFIFNALNSIQYFINISDKLSANKYLTNFAKLIRKNLDSSAAMDAQVSLAEELERIELYLNLEAMRFTGKFNFIIENNVEDSEHIMIPSMLIQPFVENSIIHGILPSDRTDGLIAIRCNSNEEILSIIIEDNGVGIDESQSQKSTYAGDHRSQGMEITSKRIAILQKITNHQLELIGPKQIIDENHSINGTSVLIKISLKSLENPTA